MRKIYLVPNFITTANMFCGFYAIVAAMHHETTTAAWAIVAAGIFDMLDGRIARLAKATSQFGLQYDSLSDLVSFGLAPGLLLYQWALEPFDRLGWLAAFFYMTCGALRLARFNVNSGDLPKNSFQGLPITMAAGVISTFVIFRETLAWPGSNQIAALILTFGLSSLMVSTIQFPSYKELNWRSRATFGYLLVGILVMILIATKPEVTMFLVLGAYISASLIWNAVRWVTGCSVHGKTDGESTISYERRS